MPRDCTGTCGSACLPRNQRCRRDSREDCAYPAVVAGQRVWLAPFEVGDHRSRILAQLTDGDRLHVARVPGNYLLLSTALHAGMGWLSRLTQHPEPSSLLLTAPLLVTGYQNGRITGPWSQVGNLPPLGRWQERPEPTCLPAPGGAFLQVTGGLHGWPSNTEPRAGRSASRLTCRALSISTRIAAWGLRESDDNPLLALTRGRYRLP